MNNILDEADLQMLVKQAPGNPAIWKQLLSVLNKLSKTHSALLFIIHFSASGSETHLLYFDQQTAGGLDDSKSVMPQTDLFIQYLSQNPYRVYFNHCGDYLASAESSSLFPKTASDQYQTGLSIPCHNQFSICLTLSRKRPFQAKEQLQITATLDQLLPDLEDAIHQEQRIKIKHQLFHLLNRSFDAFIIVDQSFNILFSDPIDRSILSKMACLEINQDCLDIKNPVLQAKLSSLFQDFEEIRSFKTPCYFFQISCVPIKRLKNLYHWECFSEGYILVFIHDKNQNDNLERLKKIYRLSNSEAICALHFVETPSINVIAESTFRSQETVRNHLKHIMQKMAVHTQAELMKKLISLIIL